MSRLRIRKPSRALRARLAHAKHVDWRRKAWKKQEGRCFYCECPMTEQASEHHRRATDATLDHKIPTSRGGEDHWENVVAACRACNRAKGDRTAEEFLQGQQGTYGGGTAC